MLQEIRITGLGIIADASLQLSAGLNVITGETGAGKTMVVSGLDLLLGARADSSMVREGAAAATVEGLVEVPVDHPAAQRAAEAGAEVDGELVLSRSVSAEGRSRAHVGGRLAPVGVLAELGELLVAVHGQADQWRLRRPEQHRALLDRFAGERIARPIADYISRYAEQLSLRAELTEASTTERERAREIDALHAGLEEIEAVAPLPQEDVLLREEDDRLAHADELRAGVGSALALLRGGDEMAADPADAADLVALLARARAALLPLARHDPALAGLGERVQELGYLAADLGGDLAAYLAGVDADPARLSSVQERRAALARLQRKYGDTVDEVLEWSRQAARRVDLLESAEERARSLGERLDAVERELVEAADRLSAARREAAAELEAQVTAELEHLAMGSAVVTVTVARAADAQGRPRFAAHGADEVEILLAPRRGAAGRSVARGASGGELSRVMLALEVVSNSADVPTFVFDEVDAGIGGAAALDVGARLARLARGAQVVVVTHLAQVAAYADRHLVVRKADDGRVVSSGVVAVEGPERLRELARMMAGSATPVALQHARELLEGAAAEHPRGQAGRDRLTAVAR